MRRMRLAFLAISVWVSFAVPALAQAVDVSGEWELTIETRRGEMTAAVKFVQDGEKLKVTMSSPRGDDTTGEGTVKGKAIQWSVTRSGPRGEITITYNGTAEGNSISGQADIGGRGSAAWKAERK
jgi:hypothetical protein